MKKIKKGAFYLVDNKIKALIFGFLFSVTYSILGFSGRCESISNKVLRLHIIANSDSDEDQSLKLKVRDKILSEFGEQLGMNENFEEAKHEIQKKLNQINFVAGNEVHNNGFNYNVNVEVTNMYFNSRRYDNVILPAGFYDALRITIGEGKGKNWWCVMFPPICLSVAEETSELEDVLTPSELDIVKNESEYSVKLKLVELIVQVGNFLSMIFEKAKSYSEPVIEKINETYEIGFKTQEMFLSRCFSE